MNFSNQLYETDENDGTVSVCLQKDVATAHDLLINIVASKLDDEDWAIGNTVNLLYGCMDYLTTFPIYKLWHAVSVLFINVMMASRSSTHP